jgi:hypothetical protein
MDFEAIAREAASHSQDECDDPDCACHQDAGERRGDGAAEVTMTEIYDDLDSSRPDLPSKPARPARGLRNTWTAYPRAAVAEQPRGVALPDCGVATQAANFRSTLIACGDSSFGPPSPDR